MQLISALLIQATSYRIMRTLLLFIIGGVFIACGPAPDQLPGEMLETESPPADKLVLSLPRAIWQDSFPDLEGEVNVFTMNSDGTNLQPLFEGFDKYNFVVGISPDRQQLLIASFGFVFDPRSVGTLYRANIDGSDTIKLADGYPFTGVPPTSPAAFWLGERNQIAYIAAEEETNGLFVTNLDNSETVRIPQNIPPPPFYIVGYTERGELFWRTGQILDDRDFLIERSLWFYNLDTGNSDTAIIPNEIEFPQIYISPIGNKAIIDGWLFDWDLKPISFTGYEHSVAYWSPDGSKIVLVVCEYENCWDPNAEYQVVVGDSNFKSTTTIPLETDGVILAADWHPGQEKVLLTIYQETDQGMELAPHVLSLETMKVEPLMENLEVGGPSYFPLWLSQK